MWLQGVPRSYKRNSAFVVYYFAIARTVCIVAFWCGIINLIPACMRRRAAFKFTRKSSSSRFIFLFLLHHQYIYSASGGFGGGGDWSSSSSAILHHTGVLLPFILYQSFGQANPFDIYLPLLLLVYY
jgi:hypothetical protein